MNFLAFLPILPGNPPPYFPRLMGMKWEHELSNLLITESGKLILLSDNDAEILGVSEKEGDLDFKLRQ